MFTRATGPYPEPKVTSTYELLGEVGSKIVLRLEVMKISRNITPERVATYPEFLDIIKSCFLRWKIKILSEVVPRYLLLRRSTNTCLYPTSGPVITDRK
jgi:hypothetical protein